MADEFYLDGEELSKESELTIIDTTKIKLIDTIEQKLKQAKDNVHYSEKSEFETNMTIVARYFTAIGEVMQLEAHQAEIDENQLIERLEAIQLSAKELSFTDLKEIEKKNEAQVEKTESTNEAPDKDGDFDF